MIENIKEIWKPSFIPDFYVSNLGRVKNIKTGRIRILFKRKNNYEFLCVIRKKKAITIGVHRLVAMAFLPNPENKPVVNHIDGNPSNNKLSNLEWVSIQENIRHSLKQLDNGVKYRCVETGKIYNWFEMRELFGFTSHNALKICLNKPRRTSHGFHWETLDNHMKIEKYVQEKQIKRISDGKVWKSQKDMSKDTGIQEGAISKYKSNAIKKKSKIFCI